MKPRFDYGIWIQMDRDADIAVALDYIREIDFKPQKVSKLQVARNLAYVVRKVFEIEEYAFGDQYDEQGVLTRSGIDYTIPFYYTLEELDTDINNEYEDGSYIERIKKAGKWDLYQKELEDWSEYKSSGNSGENSINANEYIWILEMIRDRDCETDTERDAMNVAIEAVEKLYGDLKA